MQDAMTRNSIKVTCKPEVLVSFWLRSIMQETNKLAAKKLGVHETTLSRDKIRFLNMAGQVVSTYGIPEGFVELRGVEQNVVITGDEAKALLSMLEHIREPKNKTSAATEA
ncbi:hypothetical protein [Pragia fontium]|uniref:hypothetical protein n=1 Tax=Pragia fontium TaxID=82985 RepID=UPI00064B14A4|nr:hypothetical protein [Pragia fontium]AKJ41779.1 hypothetical protein QQ39_06525 [Pragia fontium]